LIITVERSGGIAGIQSSSRAEVETLPPQMANTVQELLDSTPIKTKGSVGAADYYNYKITIQDGKHRRIINCGENDISENIKNLIRFIEKTKN
jgi:hypothetical protein